MEPPLTVIPPFPRPTVNSANSIPTRRNALPTLTSRAMSKAVTDAGKPSDTGASLPFEEALKKLESIVQAMESDDLPLESLLSKYEEGTKLAQVCQSRLADAELKIQQLEKSAAGQFVLKPLPVPQEAEA
jgi:exodeoxyribonuclease VII small subunit